MSAFYDCVFNQYRDIGNMYVGFAYGLKGNLTLKTDCVTTSEEQVSAIQNLVNSIFSITTNFLEPYHLFSYYMIAQGNQQVACKQEVQAS